MDYDTVPKFAISISVVAVVIAAAAVVMVATDDQPDDRYRLYIWMDADASTDDQGALESHIRDALDGSGFAMMWADGESSGGSEGRVLIVTLFDSTSSEADSLADSAMELGGVSEVVKETYGSDLAAA